MKSTRTYIGAVPGAKEIFSLWLLLQKNTLLAMCRIYARITNKTVVHFFHIGKTGGSSIKSTLKNKKRPYIKPSSVILSHGHAFTLDKTKSGEKFFFFVRDPKERFVSGFYSRKRKGMPRMYNEWTAGEREAFSLFDTPNQLAEALSSAEIEQKNAAEAAMRSIMHVNMHYMHWFGSIDAFAARIDDVLLVGWQSALSKHFETLKELLQLPPSLSLPTDPVGMHKNPDTLDKTLSPIAEQNLEAWYATDYEFIALLQEHELLA
jgi:hypothetical protein